MSPQFIEQPVEATIVKPPKSTFEMKEKREVETSQEVFFVSRKDEKSFLIQYWMRLDDTKILGRFQLLSSLNIYPITKTFQFGFNTLSDISRTQHVFEGILRSQDQHPLSPTRKSFSVFLCFDILHPTPMAASGSGKPGKFFKV